MRTLSILFLLASFLAAPYAQAYRSDDQQETCIRMYLKSSQIHIATEGIYYVDEAGNLEKANSIFSDNEGIYVLKYFHCPACGRVNNKNICYQTDCSLYGQ